MSAYRRSVGELLRRHRLAAGLSQEALAERAGLSRRGVSDIERGLIGAPHVDTLSRLADALELAAAERNALQAAARGQHIPPGAEPLQHSPSLGGLYPAFVGRQQELALIERQLAGEVAPFLVFAGEPGIGKSRLLAETASRAAAQGWRVLVGGCTRRSGQAPFEPLVSALAQHVRRTPLARLRLDLQGCGWLVRLLPELLETQVTPTPSWTLPPDQERRLMFGAVARYLSNVAGPAGTVLLLDDLQWAEGDAVALLETLVAEAAGIGRSAPLRLLGAYRATEVRVEDPLGLLLADLAREGKVVRRHLPPLTYEEAEILLAHLWPQEPGNTDAQVRAETLRRAEGLPFYLVSSAHAGKDVQDVQDVQDGALPEVAVGSWQVPASVAESVQARVAALSNVARSLIGVAAVTGRVIPAPVVVAVAARPEDETLDALDMLVHTGLLVEDDEETYRFAHDLIREVVEGGLGSQRRRTLHRRVAEELEHGDDETRRGRAAEIAAHFIAARERKRALPYVLLAGDRAAAVYARGEAADFYGTALGLAQTIGDSALEAEAAEKRGTTLWEGGRRDEARELGERAAHLYQSLGDRAGELRALAGIARRYAGSGQIDACEARILPRLAALEAEATEQDMPNIARVYFGLTPVYVMAFRRREALAAVERGEYFAHRVQNDELRLLNLIQRVFALAMLDLVADSLDEAVEIITLAERLGDANSLWYGFNIAYTSCLFAGDLSSAHSYLERMRRHGDLTHRPANSLNAIGELAFYLGDWRHAREAWEKQTSIEEREEPYGTEMVAGYGSTSLGTLELAQGHEAAVSSRLMPGFERAFAAGDLQAQTFIALALAEADLLATRADAAHSLLARVFTHPGMQEICQWSALLTPLMAWANLELGAISQASATIETCETYVRARGFGLILPDILRVRALIMLKGRHWRETEEALDEAVSLAQATPLPWAEAKALWVYGRLEVARGDSAAAQECLTAALAVCDQLGEGLYRPHIEHDLAMISNSPQ